MSTLTPNQAHGVEPGREPAEVIDRELGHRAFDVDHVQVDVDVGAAVLEAPVQRQVLIVIRLRLSVATNGQALLLHRRTGPSLEKLRRGWRSAEVHR
jgi:hypothetical protein